MKGKPPAKKNVSSAVFSPGASYRKSADVPPDVCFPQRREPAEQDCRPRSSENFCPSAPPSTYIFSGMAAGILLILGIAGLNRHFNTSTANYVIIDGKCYTDAKLVREQAMIAFRDVSISEEEVFATLFSE